MGYKILPLFKSCYSLGRSILTLEKSDSKINSYEEIKYPMSVFDILKHKNLDTLVLVEDNISGLLQASQTAEAEKKKLIFGLRLDINDDMNMKDDASLNRRAKYIIFAKNPAGYLALTKIWSSAARDGFYYSPCLDFKTLKKHWNNNLKLMVPFYDSFLYLNAYYSHLHVPELEFFNPTFLIEDNDLPFHDSLKVKVVEFCSQKKYDTLPAQSIFYPRQDDFEAYLAFRCIHNRGTHQKSTLDRPELDHMGSDKFSFEKWFAIK